MAATGSKASRRSINSVIRHMSTWWRDSRDVAPLNEQGALREAAGFARTLADLNERVANVWRAIGGKQFEAALWALRGLERGLQALS